MVKAKSYPEWSKKQELDEVKTKRSVKKDIEIQPGFKPGSSEFQSDALTK